MEALHPILNELESKIASKDSINTEISQSDVSWHIAHSLKVVANITKVLQSSDPKEYRWQFNWIRSLVFIFNKIPRGKGKAPKSVIPEENKSAAELQQELDSVRTLTHALENLHPKNHFKHPYFGVLNLKQTQKFLVLHTKHHLKIIDDIIK
ncbi:DinB family protein [Flavobacterium sp.]|uniref:DinB family protein n=1 Tax=Flavobacterium sp. TaxID=239 RepID=UPI002638A20E|nr:DinB family protein [Flavobacterium sp.]